ncbi:AP-2 complex subunit mu-like [Vicia villosa]|uniref:AP-2 complex subunit mu-like n=1 Tax=Vicia villosa TaxID=3911 RepID=UPI00273CF456|nr:AP-2 complex subunit mu-like [Vicia villosa]
MAVTNVISWRSEGINYKKNEVFLDVVESVNILVNSNGQIIRSDVMIQIFWICTVCGEPLSQTAQSFMPELMYGVNQSLEKVLHSFEFSQTMLPKKSKKNISTQHEVTQPQSNQPQPIPYLIQPQPTPPQPIPYLIQPQFTQPQFTQPQLTQPHP